MTKMNDSYDQCVEWAKAYLGTRELWIFEDTDGKFHAISCIDGAATFNHYANVNKWIPRGRVFTETVVNTMWTGTVLGK